MKTQFLLLIVCSQIYMHASEEVRSVSGSMGGGSPLQLLRIAGPLPGLIAPIVSMSKSGPSPLNITTLVVPLGALALGTGGIALGAATAIMSVVIGFNELIFYFKEHSGTINASLYQLESSILFEGGSVCSSAHFRLYPVFRKDIGTSIGKVGGSRGSVCIPHHFYADFFIPTHGVTMQLHGSKTTTNKKQLYIVSIEYVTDGLGVTWHSM